MATLADRRPSKDFNAIAQLGLKAHNLAVQYAANLAPRLDPAVVPGLATDLTALGMVVPGVLTAHEGAKAATKGQDQALLDGYALVTAVRLAVGRQDPPVAVRKAYGVGTRTNARVVKHVVSALQGIVDRATAQPAEAASFSITAQDVVEMTAEIATINAADAAQEAARAGAPLSTKQRNATGNRVLLAVAKVVGAGVMAFAKQPTERKSFQELLPHGR